jgi:peptidoglycan/xylan/chitin deacetylase (PgdA/CDA1 family)
MTDPYTSESVQGKKELLSRVMLRSKLLRLIREVRRDVLVIFGYHRIAPRPGFATEFADDVYGPTPGEFEAAIVWLKDNVRLISEDELRDFIARGRGPGSLSALITFDDGYRDNFTLAYPILKKHQVPAIFFIPSKMIDDRAMGWWDLSAFIVKNTRERALEINGRTFELPRERAAAISFFHKTMQLEAFERTKDLLAEVAFRAKVELPSLEERDRELMSWDEVREVSNNGITISSHSHTHRVLATLDLASQREELAASKACLEAKIGRPVRSIAYPVGGYRHFTEDTRRLAKDCGYALGYSFCTGINRFGEISSFDVKRIGPPVSIPLLAGTTVLPEVFDWDQASGYGG